MPGAERYRLARNVAFVLWAALTSWLLSSVLIDNQFRRRHQDVDLQALLSAHEQDDILSASDLGLVLWRTSHPLEVEMGQLQVGDQLRLNLRADCDRTSLAVGLGSDSIGLEVIDRWRRYVVDVNQRAGSIVLRNESEEPCDVHVSRISAVNVRDFSQGVLEFYRYPEQRPAASRTLRAMGWILLLSPLLIIVFARRKNPRSVPVALLLSLSSGLIFLALYKALSVGQGLEIALRTHTFFVLLLGLPALSFAARYLARRTLAATGAIRRHEKAPTDAVSKFVIWQRRPPNQLITVLLVCSAIYGVHLNSIANSEWDGDIRGFPRFEEGKRIHSKVGRMMPTSKGGHDGQFYALLSADPLLRQPGTEQDIDSPAFRARRIFVPVLAWLLSGGGQSSAVVVYVLLTWLGSAAAIWLVGLHLLRLNASPLWAMLLFFQAGTYTSVARALLDTSAVALTLLTLLLWNEGRWRSSTGVACAGALTKETAVLVAPAMALEAWQRREWRRGLLALLIPAGALAGWLLYLRMTVDRWTPVVGGNLDWPFSWVGQKLFGEYSTNEVMKYSEIAASASIFLAFPLAVWLVADYARTRKMSAIEWNFLAATALAAVASLKVFASIYDYSRVFLLIPFLAVLIAAERRTVTVRCLAGALVALGTYSGLNLFTIG